MKKLIVSTSTSCLDELGIPANVKMLPMNIHMDGIDYLDGQTISLDKLSRTILDNPKIQLSTSAPSETQLIDFFYQLIKEDVEEVLVICLSTYLSQTYQNLLAISAMFAHRMKIYIYDTRSISHGETILVQAASKLLEQGMEIAQIINQINRIREKTHIYLTVDNLKNMIRTKRISASAGFFANLFDIKPIVHVQDSGEIVAYEKVRNFEKCVQRMAEIIAADSQGKSGQLSVLSNALNPYTKTLIQHLTRLGYTNIPIFPASSVSIANIGVFALGVVFVED